MYVCLSSMKRKWRRFDVFIVNFEHIPHLVSITSFVNFEHVIAGWVKNKIRGKIKGFRVSNFEQVNVMSYEK